MVVVFVLMGMSAALVAIGVLVFVSVLTVAVVLVICKAGVALSVAVLIIVVKTEVAVIAFGVVSGFIFMYACSADVACVVFVLVLMLGAFGVEISTANVAFFVAVGILVLRAIDACIIVIIVISAGYCKEHDRRHHS